MGTIGLIYSVFLGVAFAAPSDLPARFADLQKTSVLLQSASESVQKVTQASVTWAEQQKDPKPSSQALLLIYSARNSFWVSNAKQGSLKKEMALLQVPSKSQAALLYSNVQKLTELAGFIPECKGSPQDFINGIRRGLAGMALEEKSAIAVCKTACCRIGEASGWNTLNQLSGKDCASDTQLSQNFLHAQCSQSLEENCGPPAADTLSLTQIRSRGCFAFALAKQSLAGFDCGFESMALSAQSMSDQNAKTSSPPTHHEETVLQGVTVGK